MTLRSFVACLAVSCAAMPVCAQSPAGQTGGSQPGPSAPTAPQTEGVDTRALYDAAKQLFDEYAPEEVKEEYEFPSHEQWDAFAQRLQKALQGGSLEELAAFEPEVRRALATFRMLPDYGDYADWLSERLDLIETARVVMEEPTPAKPPVRRPGTRDTPSDKPTIADPVPPKTGGVVVKPVPDAPSSTLPYYEVWLKRLRKRPAPARADELVPLLKVIFAAEGLPAELAWLAEVESSLNPTARSPAGARGLFQLMPATAKTLGLSLFPFDERSHPGKNARAAAKLLRMLHDRFDSWPLALAAYNAGEGRIAAALKRQQATSFADIAEVLPVETRMYVPKFFATLTVREKREILDLPAPGEPKVSRRSVAPRPDPAALPATSSSSAIAGSD